MRLEARSGVLRGSAERGLAVFRGVPFAAAPLGALRFAAPQREPKWQGEREALEFGLAPPQRSDPMIEALGLLGDHEIAEDCLTLNFWTPGLDDGRRPVMVWIHGGAFANGTGAAPIYDGARLAAAGDVVVVTLNYRVGAWGFLHHPELGPANRGLLDQLAALAWVREHAEAIGGDADRITLFGESAGAGSITALLGMPLARGAFRRAIIQSAAPAGMLETGDAEARTRALLERLAIPQDEVTRLCDVPVEALLDAQAACIAEGVWKTGMFFSPVVDGDGLPERPLNAIVDGAAAGVDLVIGTTTDEMRLFFWDVDPASVPEAAVAPAMSFELPGQRADGESTAAWARRRYEVLRRERGLAVDAASLLAAVQTDTRLVLPSLRLAEGHAAHHSATWVYRFAQPARLGALGACHALDLPFTFGTLDAPGMPAFAGNGPRERSISDGLMQAWATFARTGDPSCDALGEWPRYAAPDRTQMQIGPGAGPCRDPFAQEEAILAEIDFPDLPPAR